MKKDTIIRVLKIIASIILAITTNIIIFFLITAGMTPTEHTIMFKQNIEYIIILTTIFTGLYYIWLIEK